jgi:CheY-like chemotaxis protein
MSSPRVLIVEDSGMMRTMYKSLLTAAFPQAHIELADDGSTALSSLGDHCFDLVITDLNMPEMGGEELFCRLESQFQAGQLSRMPLFIFCSASTGEIPSLDAICERSGGRRLAKPFTVDQIEACVRSMLGPSSS